VGSYENADGVCESCPKDYYSPGPVEFYDSIYFNSNTVLSSEPWETHCFTEDGSECPGWTTGKGYMESGANGNSIVTLTKEFHAGVVTAVEFNYRIYGRLPGKFSFRIDNVEVTLRADTMHYSLTPGTHTLQWIYQHTPVGTNQRDNYVRVRDVKIYGSITSVSSCIPCPPGTVSDNDLGYCHDCPPNYFANISTEGYRECTSCPVGTFRLAGQPSCLPKAECTTEHDFVAVYPFVDNDPCNTTYEYKPKYPQICQGSTPEGESKTDCSCPSNMQFAEKMCRPCREGTYYNHYGECLNADPGYTTVPVVTYFPSNFKVSLVSEDFATTLITSK